jgi:Cu(I)/Ag(I) efflux system membrane fusion protein
MKPDIRFIIGSIVIAILASVGGYLAGSRLSKGVYSTTASPTTPSGEPGKKERKLLYYRNPMGLADTSPVPKKDQMGMDYIPVYEGVDEGGGATAGQIKISTDKVQKLGVRTEKASLRDLGKIVRATGKIEPDERRVYSITPRFEGYVERLYVNSTGQPIGKGQPLFAVYSPELVSAQREYAIATKGVQSLQNASNGVQSGMKQLADSSLMRLRNWGISEGQIAALSKSGQALRTLVFHSPVSGVVTEKKAIQGMRFMPGEMLYQVADLSSVWVIADVYEQDMALVKNGANVKVKVNAYPDQVFEGKVAYVYPTLKAETRTVPVRIELANPKQLLKPAMYAQVELSTTSKGKVIAVPDSAVIDSGTRRLVFIQLAEGRFEPREIRTGARSDNYVEVLEGVKEGEEVVVAANFLIDAESNLKAAIGGLGGQARNGDASKGSHPGKPAATGHKAEGRIDDVDVKAGTAMITHAPVESLKWPAMTMEFTFANESLTKGLKPGSAISFEFVERKPGEWVITGIQPATGGVSAPRSKAHAGH